MSSNGAGAPSAEAKARGGELGLVACTALVVGNMIGSGPTVFFGVSWTQTWPESLWEVSPATAPGLSGT